MRPRELSLSALFSVLTFIGASISIPIGPVPITLQTLFVHLAGGLLGWRLGMVSQLIYLGMGAIGMPVFAGLKAGPSVLFGPTGGYLFAFPICSMISGLYNGNDLRIRILYFSMGASAIYAIGASWLSVWLGDPGRALMLGVLPFLPGDALKLILAAYISGNEAIRGALRR